MMPKTKTGSILRARRLGALERLEKQLKDGTKTAKGSLTEKVALTDKDIKRINKQIVNIKNNLKKYAPVVE